MTQMYNNYAEIHLGDGVLSSSVILLSAIAWVPDLTVTSGPIRLSQVPDLTVVGIIALKKDSVYTVVIDIMQ